MKHTCHAEGCTRVVPPKMFACLPHWRLVPGDLQRALWAAYRPGQEDRKDPSLKYLLVQALCRIAIAEREGVAATEAIRFLRSAVSAATGFDLAQVDDARVVELARRSLALAGAKGGRS